MDLHLIHLKNLCTVSQRKADMSNWHNALDLGVCYQICGSMWIKDL